jgi:hypothetical protein
LYKGSFDRVLVQLEKTRDRIFLSGALIAIESFAVGLLRDFEVPSLIFA